MLLHITLLINLLNTVGWINFPWICFKQAVYFFWGVIDWGNSWLAFLFSTFFFSKSFVSSNPIWHPFLWNWFYLSWNGNNKMYLQAWRKKKKGLISVLGHIYQKCAQLGTESDLGARTFKITNVLTTKCTWLHLELQWVKDAYKDNRTYVYPTEALSTLWPEFRKKEKPCIQQTSTISNITYQSKWKLHIMPFNFFFQQVFFFFQWKKA